jgi:SAM-dependent methyltransferase
MNAGWGGGYVTDVGYVDAFHAIEAQSFMALAALLNNCRARLARRDEAFHLCDIGCGQGITALVAAAANPGWQVTGLDFNPGHIAGARALARAAGIGNVAFLEADLRDFDGSGLAPFDAVSMHGVWSWVDATVQDGILRLLNEKLVAGGLLHVSYNLLTGWQGALGLQRLVREAGLRLASRSDKQAAAGFGVAKALGETGGRVSFLPRGGIDVLGMTGRANAAYLAHEMMNAQWKPLLHIDVAARLAEAKLEFAGSARLINNFPQLMLAQGQREILAKFDDPGMAELFKDICQPNLLRNDVFVRGAQKIEPGLRDALLGEITLAVMGGPAEWKFEFEAGDGKAQMAEGYYRPIFERLTQGPASVAELLALPGLQGRRDNPSELIGVAVGTEQVMVQPNPGVAMDERCMRLNLVLLQRQLEAGMRNAPVTMAVPALGSGMSLPFFEGAVIHELAAQPESQEPEALVARMGVAQGPEDRAKLAVRIAEFFRDDAPLLRHLGLMD